MMMNDTDRRHDDKIGTGPRKKEDGVVWEKKMFPQCSHCYMLSGRNAKMKQLYNKWSMLDCLTCIIWKSTGKGWQTDDKDSYWQGDSCRQEHTTGWTAICWLWWLMKWLVVFFFLPIYTGHGGGGWGSSPIHKEGGHDVCCVMNSRWIELTGLLSFLQ